MNILKTFFDEHSKISDDSFARLSSIFYQKDYNKKDVIVRAGEIQHYIYVVLSGVARSYVIDKSGRDNIRTLFTPVSVIAPLQSLVNKKPSTSNFDCLTDVKMLRASFEDMKTLTKKHHDISELYSILLEKSFNRMESRVNSLTTLDATERYLELKDQAPDIEQLIPLNQIASYLNITPIQFSRIRKKLYSN